MDRVNFSKLIKDLCDFGWTQTEIGTYVGLPQSVISDLQNGKIKEPRYHAGTNLVDLHKAEMWNPND